MPKLKNWNPRKRIDGKNSRSNAERADAAEAVVDAYCLAKEGRPQYDSIEGILSDLLADLMHYCDQEGIDFDECVDRGRCHYEEEKAEEQPKKRRTKS